MNSSRQHDHDVCVSTALKRASILCDKKDLRLTKLREQVLELVWQSHSPIGAYVLMEMLEKKSGRKRVAPPTVYRALDFLVENGLIYKVHSLNAFFRRSNPSEQRNDALFICNKCGYTTEVISPSIQQAINLSASQQKFSVKDQVMEIVGECARCRGQL